MEHVHCILLIALPFVALAVGLNSAAAIKERSSLIWAH